MENVWQTLQSCEIPNLRESSERQLALFEKQPGFIPILIQCLSTYCEPSAARLLAVLCIKNTVNRHWKRLETSDTECLKSFLLSSASTNKLEETQLAVIHAKVARHEWPVNYQSLFPSLFANDNINVLRLRFVIKELSTKRLMMHKKAFTALAVDIFNPLVVKLINQDHQEYDRDLIKVCKCLVVNAFPSLSLQEFFNHCHHILHNIKMDKTICRMLIQVQKKYEEGFKPYILPFFHVFANNLSVSNYAVEFVTSVLSNNNTIVTLNEDQKAELMSHVLNSPLLKLTSEELELWQSDPIEFTSITPSSNASCNLFLTLLATSPKCKSQVCRELLTQFHLSEDVLKVDAQLLVIGLACFDLHDESALFKNWYTNSIETLLLSSNSTIIQRRVVWLSSCWVGHLNESQLYRLHSFIMSVLSSNDIVLLDTCINALLVTIEYYYDGSNEIVQGMLSALMTKELSIESTASCFSIIEIVIAKGLVTNLGGTVDTLSNLWSNDNRGDSSIIKASILSLLAVIDKSSSSCDKSTNLYPLLASVISSSVTLMNLAEPALVLWHSVLQNASTAEVFFPILSILPPIIMSDFEHLKIALSIVESYVLLSTEQSHLIILLTVVKPMLLCTIGIIKPALALHWISVVDIMMLKFGSSGTTTVIPSDFIIELCQALSIQVTDKSSNKEPDMVIIGYLTIIARAIVLSDNHITSISSALVQSFIEKYHAVLYSSTSTKDRRTLWALCLLKTLELKDDSLGMVLELVADVVKSSSDDDDSLKNDSITTTTLEDQRRTKLLNSTLIVNSVNLVALTHDVLGRICHAEGFKMQYQFVEKHVIQTLNLPQTF